jgi:pantetheine-phosphate adenylyltransferase
MKTCACFPGSFDPFTKGHQDIVQRALTLFDEVIIAIGENTSKQSFFDKQKRLEHISSLFNNDARVSITFFQGLPLYSNETP